MNVFQLRGFVDAQLEGPRQHLALTVQLSEELLRRPRTAADAAALLGHALDRARLANALGHSDELQRALSDAASLSAAMTIRQRVSGGEIELTTAAGKLRFPDGDTGASPPVWLDGLACAVVMRDATACEYLANPISLECVVRAASSSDRPIGHEPFWFEYGRAFVALMRGDPVAVAHAQRAQQQISAGATGVLVREALAITDTPVLRLIEIVAAGATAEWPGALDDALTRFHEHFSSAERAHNLPGYLPLLMLAVCSLAVERGFSPPAGSPYLPENLTRNRAVRNPAQLIVRYPLQSILSAEEAHWFLDLQGYPRSERSHRLIDRDGNLIAHYEVAGSAGLPPASAEFVVGEEAGASPALDAGQLLFLAQAFASQVPAYPANGTPNARVLLADAIACVDAVLARIPAQADQVPEDSIRSEEGRALVASEPGRLRRSRLQAYRAGLNAQLEGSARQETTQTDSSQIYASSLFQEAQRSIDAIRAMALPVLEAFAQDADGTFIAHLQPRDDDYAKVFRSEAVSKAASVYRELWSRGLNPARPRPTQSEIRCAVAPAGMLTWDNELSHQFPGGYQGIAASLNPHRVWLAWQYVATGQTSGMSFDGLVWLDDHWAWFPKPYRYLVRCTSADEEQ